MNICKSSWCEGIMKFLSLNLVITVFLITLISCTKEKKKTVNIKTFGKFKYVEAESTDKGLLAEFSDIKITKDEVNKKSKVIQELNQQESDLHSILVYRMATNYINKLVEDKEELKESYDLKIYTPEPKEGFTALANRIKLNIDDRINVKFEEMTEEVLQSKIIGEFENTSYTLDNVEKNHIRYIEILTQKFDESLRQVKGILTRKLLFSDAKAKGMSVQDLVNNHIIKNSVSLTDNEVVEFMKSKSISESEMTEQMTKSFRNILMEQKKNKIIEKYVSENLATGTVKMYNKAPKIEFDIKPDWSPIFGSEQAGNSIYFFTNPNCSVCAGVKNNIMTALNSNKYNVKLHTFYFFPDWDREAKMFAESAMCVFSQDKEKFWDYHNMLVDFEGKVAEANLYEFANEIGLEAETFKSCVLNRKTQEIVDYHLKYADYLGVNSQPTLIIKGKIYPGIVDVEKLVQVFSNDLIAVEKPGLVARIINYFKNLFS